MKLTVSHIKQETKDAVTISFKNNSFFQKVKYKPGQFLTVCVTIDGTQHKRAYSFSSNPFSDKDLKITVKKVHKGLVSNYLNNRLQVGDKIEIEKPTGSFYLDFKEPSVRQYVLFAGGSGITPIFSILKSILIKEPKSKILVIYANQDVESIIFHREINDLMKAHLGNLAIEHILSTNTMTSRFYHKGLVTTEFIQKTFKKHGISYKNNVTMICGPYGYMEKIIEVLALHGVTRDKIKVEVFKSPQIKIIGKNQTSAVTIKLDGKEYQIIAKWTKSILQQAMSKNIPIPYSCRSGMCSSCKASCTSGNVTMTEGHLLNEDEVKAGKILTCVSYPASESIVIEL